MKKLIAILTLVAVVSSMPLAGIAKTSKHCKMNHSKHHKAQHHHHHNTYKKETK